MALAGLAALAAPLEAGHGRPLASEGVRPLLDVEVSRRPGRPHAASAIRDLIQQMCQANFLWGAPRIHGELLKLGIEVAPSTVGKYLRRHRNPPSQTWRTFLKNHMKQTASMDFRVEEIPAGCRLPLAVSTVSGFGRGRDSSYPLPTGWPEAVAHLRLPQNVACRFPALRSSEVVHSMAIACSSL